MRLCLLCVCLLVIESVLGFHFPEGKIRHSNLVVRESLLKYHKPFVDSVTGKMFLRNETASSGKKWLRASGLVLGQKVITLGLLYALPEDYSRWKRKNLSAARYSYKEAFTKLPVIDRDDWSLNYVGHSYQGMMYYNALRSQGAPMWQSMLFCAFHSLSWEYLWEAHQERPSVQDIFYTPFAGVVLGELSHFATMRMARHGFKWYEAMVVCFINPMFAINNGFKRSRHNNGGRGKVK